MVNIKQSSILSLAILTFAAPSFAAPVGTDADIQINGCVYNDQVVTGGTIQNYEPSNTAIGLQMNVSDDIGRGFEENTTYSFLYSVDVSLASLFTENPSLDDCFDLSQSFVNYTVTTTLTNAEGVTLVSPVSIPYTVPLSTLLGSGGDFPHSESFQLLTDELLDSQVSAPVNADVNAELEIQFIDLVPSTINIDGVTSIQL